MLLSGPPGIGKTRLAGELAQVAEGTVLYGSCPQEPLLSYQPFVEALGHYVRNAGTTGAPELAQLIPGLEIDPAPGPAPEDPETRRFLMFEAVSRLLSDAGSRAPVLLALDDLHWADRPTLQLLRHVLRAQDEAPLLIVGTHREGEAPAELGELLADLRRDRLLHGVTLAGLDEPGVARADRRKIVTATGAMFGGFPFDRYLFIIHCLTARGGGLEHAASCTLDIAGLGFEDDKAYQRFEELAAHEFFHAWNVKRIRDRVLGPFDYRQENHSRLLWFHEGFTEYMESIVLLRAGLLDAETYIDDLAEDWPKYLSRPGRNVTPLTELSFEAWTKLYKPADNHTNRTVSYYEKGKWAALVLEILVREATQGRRGVEQLFRRLWGQFGRRGIGITEADLQAAVTDTAGRSLGSYFSRYIRGTDELPVPALLRRAGLKVESRPPWQEENGDRIRARRQQAWSGIAWAGGPAGTADRAVVKTVVPDSPAWRAGITYGDEVIAVDGQKVNAVTAPRRLADHDAGDRVVLHLFRREALQTARLTLATSPERKWQLSFDERPSQLARAVRHGWLGV